MARDRKRAKQRRDRRVRESARAAAHTQPTRADVPPIRGVYRGAAGAALDARVKMTRLDPAASASP